MNKVYFTVGPTQLYPTAAAHLQKGLEDDIYSISHRSEKFKEIFIKAVNGVREILGVPDDFSVFFVSSATEAMERVLENTVEKKSLNYVNGVFSKRFYSIAEKLGKNAEKVEAPQGRGFSKEQMEIESSAECICIVHNETSTGASFPLDDIYKIKVNNTKAILAVDIVSSVPYIKPDFRKIDMAFFSVQKGMGLPAGLGVLIVNKASLEKARVLEEKGLTTSGFHDFLTMEKYYQKNQTHETPNVLGIYLLSQVCEDMLKKGIDNIRQETEIKADMIYDFFAKHIGFEIYVKDAEFRSRTTIVVDVAGRSEEITKKLAGRGFVVSRGYGVNKDTQIRIANFPAHTIENVRSLLSEVKKI